MYSYSIVDPRAFIVY